MSAEGYFRDRGSGFLPSPLSEGSRIAVCTMERALGLLNRMIEAKCIDLLRVVVIDEVHMIGDESRGWVLETIIAKLRFLKMPVQFVCMSATLPNLSVFENWIEARCFETRERPIPLSYYLYEVMNDSHACARKFELDETTNCLILPNGHLETRYPIVRSKMTEKSGCQDDASVIWPLINEVLERDKSVLIFVPTRSDCSSLANGIKALIIKHAPEFLRRGAQDPARLSRIQALEDLTVSNWDGDGPGAFSDILRDLIEQGVAFHHAGLTSEERIIVETAFGNGYVRVLVATTSLAIGVNLPAARVILWKFETGAHNGTRLLDARVSHFFLCVF